MRTPPTLPPILSGVPIPAKLLYREKTRKRRKATPPSPWIAHLKKMKLRDSIECGRFDVSCIRLNAVKAGIRVIIAGEKKPGVINGSFSMTRYNVWRIE